MISKCIFVILTALYGLAILFFVAKIFSAFWQVCIAYVKYIKLVRKIDSGTFLFIISVAVTVAVTILVAFIIYIIGAALWMMNCII